MFTHKLATNKREDYLQQKVIDIGGVFAVNATLLKRCLSSAEVIEELIAPMAQKHS
jgi:hypothetical protein